MNWKTRGPSCVSYRNQIPKEPKAKTFFLIESVELKAILDKEMDKNRKLLRDKELLEEKVERANQIKQESSDIQVCRMVRR